MLFRIAIMQNNNNYKHISARAPWTSMTEQSTQPLIQPTIKNNNGVFDVIMV